MYFNTEGDTFNKKAKKNVFLTTMCFDLLFSILMNENWPQSEIKYLFIMKKYKEDY